MSRDNSTHESVGNAGTVRIADDVVVMIAALAASEIEGVHGMAGDVTRELLGRVGVSAPDKGVKVEINGKSVRANISIVMEYGYNIPTTCQKIQERVKSSIENMTGLNVTDVNVRISGISAPAR